jgi:hypothetical protein
VARALPAAHGVAVERNIYALQPDSDPPESSSHVVHRLSDSQTRRPMPPASLAIRLALLFVVGLGVSLLLIPRPLGKLQYMVAGSVATATALAGGFAMVRLPRSDRPIVRIRIARRP